MIESNGNFIPGCELCGRDDWVASELTLQFNYGSKHDGEVLTLDVCGDCADRIYQQIVEGC